MSACLALALVSACGGAAGGTERTAPRGFQVREGEEFVVPHGHVAVVTYLGADSITISDVGLMQDGKVLISCTPHLGPDETTVLAVLRDYSRISVCGGLVEEQDALCSGYLLEERNVVFGSR